MYFCVLQGTAQEKVWLDATLRITADSNNASYYLISEKTGHELFDIKIYRRDKTLLMEGTSADSLGVLLEGNSKWYYENGNIESEGNYTGGKKTGVWKRYTEEGKPRPDRYYTDVSMKTYVFNTARIPPRPPDSVGDPETYIYSKIPKDQLPDMMKLSPLRIQFVILIDGSISQVKIDERCSRNQHFMLKSIIESMPAWTPGNNGTKNINVRVTYNLEFSP